jgi:hypothetical protein
VPDPDETVGQQVLEERPAEVLSAPHGPFCREAASVQQGNEAHEARVEVERGMVGGCCRGRAVIAWVPACWRASQLSPVFEEL